MINADLPERQDLRSTGTARAEISGQQSSEFTDQRRNSVNSDHSSRQSLHVALLTGGGDKPYALGMAAALTSVGIFVDFIGSDDLNVPELLANPRIQFS